jgi:hypothetical protein
MIGPWSLVLGRASCGRAGLLLGMVVSFATGCGSHGDSSTGPGGSTGTGSVQSGRIPPNSVSCGTKTALLTVTPIPLSFINGWVPLGQMAPSGHTFPTDHQYLYINGGVGVTTYRTPTLVAPTDMYVTYIHAGTTTPPGLSDYTIEFSVCTELYEQFGHVASIAPSLLAQAGAIDQGCQTYSPSPGTDVTTCETKQLAIAVHAGDAIGTAGGDPPHSIALDFSFWDSRVPANSFANSSRWPKTNDGFDSYHVVPASDYFAEPVKSQVTALLGTYDGSVHRTIAPTGGTIAVDIAGTAMGHWFNPTQPVNPETPHLAIAPDNVSPDRVGFSIGLSLPGWTLGLQEFTPVNTGNVNRNPGQVTADGNIYCYESPGNWILLLRMPSATTLQLEGRPGAAGCAAAQPWTFTGASFTYSR